MNPVQRLITSALVALAIVAGLGACSKEEAAPAALVRLGPEEFAARMGNSGAEVINVHIPYEGELEDTDAFIPFDQIVGDTALPADKGSEVLLYCMTGRMSVTAGDALTAAGYTDVSHLEGGMRAWEAAGKTLLHNTQESGPGH